MFLIGLPSSDNQSGWRTPGGSKCLYSAVFRAATERTNKIGMQYDYTAASGHQCDARSTGMDFHPFEKILTLQHEDLVLQPEPCNYGCIGEPSGVVCLLH